MATTYGRVMESPVGPLTLEASPQGLKHIRFGSYEVVQSGHGLQFVTDAAKQLKEYFAGTRRQFDLTLDVQGTPFQMRVWDLLDTIPYGHTTTYGRMAAHLGNSKLARAVGSANGANPLPIVRPCHRVIGHNSRLTGFGGGLDKKALLLQHESGQGRLFQL